MAIYFKIKSDNPDNSNNAHQFLSRDQIDSQYKWNPLLIFQSDEAWETAFNQLKQILSKLDNYSHKLAESADTLLECLETRSEIETLLGKLNLYVSLRNDEDTRIAKYQAMRDKIAMFSVEVNQKSAFIEPEILSIPEPKIWEFSKNNEKLGSYQHYFQDLLRSKEHVLSKKEEEILALTGDIARSPYQIFSMFNNADLKFPRITDENGNKVELTKGNYLTFLKSQNRKVRERAFRTFYSKYKEWENSLAATLSGAIKGDIFYAKIRKYPSALQSALDSDNIPVKVYDNLINTVHNNLQPMHRYISLRKKVLGLKAVKPWDLFVPLIKELKWEVTYEEAVSTVLEACKPLGNNYLQILQEGFNSRWIDVYENQGKRSGAYSAAVYGARQPYVLLNYHSRLDDMFTLAHEMGHSLHSYLTNQSQPYIYSNYAIFVAEVASTLNEVLLTSYLLQKIEDKQKKLYLLNHHLEQIQGTYYIQILFAEYEKIIHEKVEAGEALTAESLSALSKQLYLKFYGPEFSMDKLYTINWSRIPHFYYNFYVFQYATGYSAAMAIARKILDGEGGVTEAYLNFLSSGSSDYPINLLKKVGVDMTSAESVEATARLFNDLLTEMEILLAK